jgi:hypothetical protein
MSYIPTKIADYFGDAAETAVIVAQFRPADGWEWLDATCSYDTLRVLRARGVTAVEVMAAGRGADFTIAEVLADAARPVFGGRVI